MGKLKILFVQELSRLVRSGEFTYSGLQDKTGVNRQKLKRIIDGSTNEQLSLDQIEKIHDLLSERGKGLDRLPFYMANSLVRKLDEFPRVGAFVGAREDGKGLEISRWTMRAVGHLLEEVNRSCNNARLRLEDVYVTGSEDRSINTIADRPDLDSIVSFGPPHSNPMSEIALSEALSLRPFDPRKRSGLPFQFLTGSGSSKQTSSFGLAVPKLGKGTLGIRVDGHGDYLSTRNADTWTTYGVFFACFAGLRLNYVLAGLTGPATYGISQSLNQIDIERLSPRNPIWSLLEIKIQETGDNRRRIISSTEVVLSKRL